MTKTCGTCKHWGGHNPPVEDAQFKHHPCNRVKHDDNWEATPSDLVVQDWDINAVAAAKERMASVKDSAVVQDASGAYAALKTREDFGCVLWEQK